MADAAENSQEPTMEEILSSIRKIISDDDEPGAESAPETEGDIVAEEPKAEAPPAPEPEPVAEAPAAEEEVFDLTERVDPEPEPAEADGDLMIFDNVDDAVDMEPAPPPAPEAKAEPVIDEEPLVTEDAADSVSGAFTQLASNIMVTTEEGVTLEDLIRGMLKPMLKEWLDRHLAEIVNEKVQAEVERLARRGRRFG